MWRALLFKKLLSLAAIERGKGGKYSLQAALSFSFWVGLRMRANAELNDVRRLGAWPF